MKLKRQWIVGLIPLIIVMIANQSVFAAPVTLSLDDSIKMALENNHDIKYAKSSREKSYWALEETKKNKKVSVDYNHTSERYKTSTSSGDTYTNDFDNQVTLTLPIYSGGKLEGEIDQAKFDLKVADLEIAATKQQLKLDVVKDYFTVLEYRNEVQVDQETVNNYVDHLNLVKVKYDQGLVAKTDILSSQVDLAKAQDTLIIAQNNYNNAVATLNNAIGLPHHTELQLKDDFTYEKYSLPLEECIQYAKDHRPEIVQYEAKVASAHSGVKIAKSGYLPTVDFTAQEGWNDSHTPGLDNNNWTVKLTASFNVFDSGINNAKVKQAQHNVDMVGDQAEKEQDSILLDVRQYYFSMQEAEKRIDTNKVSVNYAQESLMIQQARYAVGIGTNLDLLDAVLSLATAKKDLIQALYDYNTNKAKLEKAMGLSVE
ncbi:TolC family protein [Pelosinus fermentans]|uniref:Outer membrane efflux protein n=1 Tax=Pelosinus fermentans JBW45 TaxID=1192197 RepID=I9NTD9_9FIRM|nr:TolC family protein [Pelosinus fermentans]AJQ26436.1 outer membrane efflux protein [Pelosinus fermentans JBW45]